MEEQDICHPLLSFPAIIVAEMPLARKFFFILLIEKKKKLRASGIY